MYSLKKIWPRLKQSWVCKKKMKASKQANLCSSIQRFYNTNGKSHSGIAENDW